jgi:hypothetical protein
VDAADMSPIRSIGLVPARCALRRSAEVRMAVLWLSSLGRRRCGSRRDYNNGCYRDAYGRRICPNQYYGY